MHSKNLWRALLFALCALVFFFALHAKTAVYSGISPVKATPSTASKLWLNGQKLDLPPVDSTSVAVFWMALLCLYSLSLRREGFVRNTFLVPPPRNSALRHLHPFLRPPPAQF